MFPDWVCHRWIPINDRTHIRVTYITCNSSSTALPAIHFFILTWRYSKSRRQLNGSLLLRSDCYLRRSSPCGVCDQPWSLLLDWRCHYRRCGVPHDGHRRLTNSIDGWFHTSRKCDSGTGHGLADGGVSCGWRSTAENDRVPRNRLIGHQHLRMHESCGPWPEM